MAPNVLISLKIICNSVESSAMFCDPNVTLSSLDPYNNTFGEKNWLIILLVVFSCLYCTFGMFLALGIVLFEKYGLNPGNRQIVDMVRKLSYLFSFSKLLDTYFQNLCLQNSCFIAPVIFNGDCDNSIWTRNVPPISSKCDWTFGKY